MSFYDILAERDRQLELLEAGKITRRQFHLRCRRLAERANREADLRIAQEQRQNRNKDEGRG
jgi:hypothetical protein